MRKYVIKNCDLFNSFSEECLKDNGLCEFCTDCVMKQIVELCRKAPILDADWILNKLDIQEIE